MTTPLTDAAYLKSLLAKRGIVPQRQASQNFLVCAPVVDEALAAAQAGPRRVTELGAGIGVMTGALLEQGFAVRAIERDQRLAELAQQLMPPHLTDRLTLVIGDLRHVAWGQDEPYQLVGNIPYHLSGLIIRQITQLEPQPQQVILLVQKEVGSRLVSTVPQLQLIGLAVQLWGTVRILTHVPASCFWPAPRVDSSLLLLTPAEARRAVSLAEREAIVATAQRFFRQRRKQMGGVLKRWQRLDDATAAALLRQSGIRPEQRPQEITLQQWITLHQALGR